MLRAFSNLKDLTESVVNNCLRCSNTLYMYDIDVGCSLKGSTASTIAQWDHFHTYIIYDFSKISQIW